MDQWHAVLNIIKQAGSFGVEQLSNGTTLWGHVPHVAPEAWLHQLHSALNATDIAGIEARIGRSFPPDFVHFLKTSNGMMLFSCTFSIYGKRTSYSRKGDGSRQPFCIVSANTLERPDVIGLSQLVIGGYNDGSLLYIDATDGTVTRKKPRSRKVMHQWASFWKMLLSETCRVSQLFDDHGRKTAD
jgi:hypothetical protein